MKTFSVSVTNPATFKFSNAAIVFLSRNAYSNQSYYICMIDYQNGVTEIAKNLESIHISSESKQVNITSTISTALYGIAIIL